MCSSFKVKGKTKKPSEEVFAVGEEGLVRLVWSGFARLEILDWWKKRGGQMVDIPAEEFAERSEVTGQLVWDKVPDGAVIYGLRESEQSRTLKVITRASDQGELQKFGHPRMPCIGEPKFPAAEIPEETDPQGWLF